MKEQPTMRSESRGQIYLHYAEPRGGKACEAGLKFKEFFFLCVSPPALRNFGKKKDTSSDVVYNI